MSGLRGVLVGVLGLTALELVLGSDYASNSTGTFFDLVGRTAQAVISPAVPAIPDRRKGETYGVATASTAAAGKPSGGGEWIGPAAPVSQPRLNPTATAQPPVESTPTPQPGPAPHP